MSTLVPRLVGFDYRFAFAAFASFASFQSFTAIPGSLTRSVDHPQALHFT
jgi:hypothetical protein